MSSLSRNTSPRIVTAAVSLIDSSPSPSVSQFSTQIAFTLVSAKLMFSANTGIAIANSNSVVQKVKKDRFIVYTLFIVIGLVARQKRGTAFASSGTRVLRKPEIKKRRHSPTHICAEAALPSCLFQLLL